MEPGSISLMLKASTLFLKIFKPIGKIFGKKIDVNYFLYRRMYPMLSSSNSFDRIYSETIRQLDKAGVIREVLDLFSTYSVRESFKRSYGKGTVGNILDSANAEIAVNPKFTILTGNIEPELDRFFEIFIKQAQLKRTPSDIIAEERNVARFKGLSEEIRETFVASRDYLDLSNQIKHFSELRNNGQHKAVLTLLEDYKRQNWELLKPDDRRKIQINLGVTHFEMEHYEEASKFLVDTINYGEENADACSYVALGYAVMGDSINAKYYAEKAVLLDPNNINGYSALLAAEKGLLTIEKIEEIIPDNIRKLPVFALSLGARMEQMQKFDEAVSLYEGALQSFLNKDFNYYEITYHLALAKFRSLFLKDQSIFDQLSDYVVEKAKEVLKLYDESWNYFKETDLRNSKWYILTNKATVLRLLKDYSGAEQALRTSIDLNPTFFSYKNLYILLLDQDRDQENIVDEMLKLASTDAEFGETVILKAEALLNKGNSQDAIDLLTSNFDKCSKSDIREGFYAVLINALILGNKIIDAEEIAAKFLKEEPDNFYANFFKIQIADAKKDNVDMSEIDNLKRLITPESPVAYSVKLADLFLSRDAYEEAANIIEPVIQNDTYSPLAQRLLHCYYSLGNHAKGIPFAEKLFAKNSSNPYVADYLSVIYETISDFGNAIRVIDTFLQHVPNDIHFKVKKAIIFCKDNRIDEGVVILNGLSRDIETLPIEVQFFIANAYLKVDLYNQGMEIAYNVRMRNYANPVVHENYVKLLMAIPDKGKDFYFPGTVQDDCYVMLVDDSGKQIEYIIVNDPKFVHDIGLQEDITRKLIGRALNETVDINDSTYTIGTIIRKYTYAHHDSINQISMRFADQVHSMKILKFPPNPSSPEEALKPILNSIDSSTEYEEKISELYPNVQATIGSNAQLLGENPIDYWGRITSNWEIGCYSIGSSDEYRKASELMTAGTPIVVDIISLLTLFHIDGFELLKLLNNPIYVTESTLAVIENKIAAYELTKSSLSFSLGKQGNQYFKHEFTLEEKEKHAEALNLLFEKTKAYCLIGESVLSSSYDDKKKLDDALGESFHDSALLTSKKNWLLYSDDRNFRIISFNQMQLAGMSTFTLLHFLWSVGSITLDQYNSYMVLLVRHNYRSLPVNDAILFEALKFSDYKVQQPLLNASDIFGSLDDIKAIKLGVDFLYRVYVESVPILREPITRFLLTKIFADRNSFHAKNLFVVYLNKRFALMPIQCAEILQLL